MKKNIKTILIFVVIVFGISRLSSAQTRIEGSLAKDFAYDKIFLFENIGGKYYPKDSCEIGFDRKFSFNGAYPTGFYSIFSTSSDWVQFIVNNDDSLVSFRFPKQNLRDSILILNSPENQNLWKFINQRKAYNSLISASYSQKTYYLPDSQEYSFFQKREDSLVNELNKFIMETYVSQPNSFLGKTIISDYKTENRDGFFKYTFFNEADLIRSGVLTLKVTQYLQLQTEYTENGFISSIDKILNLASENPIVYEFVLNYLLELFNQVGPDIILDYLVNHYVLENSCTDMEISQVIENKLDSYKKTQTGQKLPPFSLFDETGTLCNLNDLIGLSNYTLLFFGSSHCPFCQDSNPILSQVSEMNDFRSFKVIYISFDTTQNELLMAKKSYGKKWIILSELKSWDSKLAQYLMIHKTPSFIMLDKTANIISKPKDLTALLAELSRLDIKKPAN